jgi:hypothetical protein
LDYSRTHRAIEIAAITAFATLGLVLWWGIIGAAADRVDWLIIGIMSLASYLFADFGSGVVHWVFDRYGDEATPIAGNNFIRPFRHHHVDPTEIARHDFVETNGNNCVATLPFLCAGLSCDATTRIGLGCAVFCLGVSIGVFATNQFHSWAHSPAPPWIARWLQRARLILRPDHHERHHDGDFDSYYCITTGWMNPLIERTRLFATIERVFPPHPSTAMQAGAQLRTIRPQLHPGKHHATAALRPPGSMPNSGH